MTGTAPRPAMDRAPRADLRLLLIALVIWVQLFVPFVHAHAGKTQLGGWHLHTQSALAAGQPAQRIDPSGEGAVWRPQTDTGDATEVGVATGLPQDREAARKFSVPSPDEADTPGADRFGTGDVTMALLPLRGLSPSVLPEPPSLASSRPARASSRHPGLPPPALAPPLLT